MTTTQSLDPQLLEWAREWDSLQELYDYVESLNEEGDYEEVS